VNSLVPFDVQHLVQDTGASLLAFRPELILAGTIVAVLLVKVVAPGWKTCGFHLTWVGLLAALCFSWPPNLGFATSLPIFTGALVSDSFTIVLRWLVLLFAILFVALTRMSSTIDQDDMTEFYVLMLGALLGMCLMISANHLLLVLLGVEMASVPCYVLAGMQRSRPKSSEAALKYAVFGAGTAGVMLYGMSLLAGVLGSAHLPTMAVRLAELLGGHVGTGQATVLILGGLMLTVGVAFKLSAVPFHFWAPDVFEGATAEVAAFLSVASKAAALGLLVRLATGFAFPAAPSSIEDFRKYLLSLAHAREYIVAILSVLAVVTCTFGNLAAYGQTNMKRLLAYSTIAHAGYMMMPVVAAVSLAGGAFVAARYAVASLVVYIGIYLFMNLAAFSIVAFLRNVLGSEEIADYAGLVRRSPGLAVCMAIVMFSLVGLPPLAGFQAKWTIFYALVQADLWPLLLIGVLNTVLSLFYYLRVVRVMIFAPEPLYRDAPEIPLNSIAGIYCAFLTFFVVGLFFAFTAVLNVGATAAGSLFR
jgi:NADH-quinone oxidoreductase subunit N